MESIEYEDGIYADGRIPEYGVPYWVYRQPFGRKEKKPLLSDTDFNERLEYELAHQSDEPYAGPVRTERNL